MAYFSVKKLYYIDVRGVQVSTDTVTYVNNYFKIEFYTFSVV